MLPSHPFIKRCMLESDDVEGVTLLPPSLPQRADQYRGFVRCIKVLQRLIQNARARIHARSCMARALNAVPALSSLRGLLRLVYRHRFHLYLRSVEPWARRMHDKRRVRTAMARLRRRVRQRRDEGTRLAEALHRQHSRRLGKGWRRLASAVGGRQGEEDRQRVAEAGFRHRQLPRMLHRWRQVVEQRRAIKQAVVHDQCRREQRALGCLQALAVRSRGRRQERERLARWRLRRNARRSVWLWLRACRQGRWRRARAESIDSSRVKRRAAVALSRRWRQLYMGHRRHAQARMQAADGMWAKLAMARVLRALRRHVERSAVEGARDRAIVLLRKSLGLWRLRKRVRERVRRWRVEQQAALRGDDRHRGVLALQGLRRWRERTAELTRQWRCRRAAKELRYELKLHKGFRAWRVRWRRRGVLRDMGGLADDGYFYAGAGRALKRWLAVVERRRAQRQLVSRARHWRLHKAKARGVRALQRHVRRRWAAEAARVRALGLWRRRAWSMMVKRWVSRFRARRDYRVKARVAGRMLRSTTLYKCFMAMKGYHHYKRDKARALQLAIQWSVRHTQTSRTAMLIRSLAAAVPCIAC